MERFFKCDVKYKNVEHIFFLITVEGYFWKKLYGVSRKNKDKTVKVKKRRGNLQNIISKLNYSQY